MRTEIKLNNVERLKLKLMLEYHPYRHMDESLDALISRILACYLAHFQIRECAAARCDRKFTVDMRKPGRRREYCSNACRVAKSREVK